MQLKLMKKMIISGKESAKQNNNEATLFKRQTNTVANKKEQVANNFFNAQVVTADNSHPLPIFPLRVKILELMPT